MSLPLKKKFVYSFLLFSDGKLHKIWWFVAASCNNIRLLNAYNYNFATPSSVIIVIHLFLESMSVNNYTFRSSQLSSLQGVISFLWLCGGSFLWEGQLSLWKNSRPTEVIPALKRKTVKKNSLVWRAPVGVTGFKSDTSYTHKLGWGCEIYAVYAIIKLLISPPPKRNPETRTRCLMNNKRNKNLLILRDSSLLNLLSVKR